MKHTRLFFSLLLTLLLGISTTTPLFAQDSAVDRARNTLGQIGVGTGFSTTENLPTDDVGFYTRFALIVNIVLGMVGIISTLYLFYAGIKWISAGGNSEQIDDAKAGIRSAVIGLLVIFISYIVVNFVVTGILNAVTK